MTLQEKIKAIYPELQEEEFHPVYGTILLQNDGDGKGDYIAKWEHPTLARPTSDQLAESNQNEELA
jgi:hypothetical protein